MALLGQDGVLPRRQISQQEQEVLNIVKVDFCLSAMVTDNVIELLTVALGPLLFAQEAPEQVIE
jgi:hypothetical protein